jgi:thiol-disulfide isomerase/thioredoxin
MNQSKSKTAKRPPSSRAPQPAPRRRLPLVAILLGVVAVLLVGAIAVTALTKDDSSSGSSGSADVEQTRPVSIAGTPLPLLPHEGDDPAVGMTAPVLTGASFTGETETLGGATAKPTLAVFVAHWCPHCQREVPLLVQWADDGTIPEDIDLVAVSTAVGRYPVNYPPSEWLDREGWPGRIIADDQNDTAAQAYGLPSYPYFLALDKEGKVVARGTGELDQAQVAELVDKLQGA